MSLGKEQVRAPFKSKRNVSLSYKASSLLHSGVMAPFRTHPGGALNLSLTLETQCLNCLFLVCNMSDVSPASLSHLFQLIST